MLQLGRSPLLIMAVGSVELCMKETVYRLCLHLVNENLVRWVEFDIMHGTVHTILQGTFDAQLRSVASPIRRPK